jgi:addiction module HigA family antidote
MSKMHNPAHAGQILAEWLDGLKENNTPISITELAENIHITRAMLSRIINGKAPLTADIALRLHDALGVSAEMLMKVQANHSLWAASQKQRPSIKPLHHQYAQ